MTFDPINKPSHYAEGRKYEPIKVIEDWQLGYRLGNATKYISRAGRKDPAKTIEDLKKAVWYIEREIQALEGPLPYAVTYEDVLEDHAACASEGYEPLSEYAVDDNWEHFWNDNRFDLYVTNTSVNLDRKNDGPVGAAGDDVLWDPCLGPVELTEEEIVDSLARKALEQFTDDEIVSTFERRGMIIGVKKDGATCVLGDNGRCE